MRLLAQEHLRCGLNTAPSRRVLASQLSLRATLAMPERAARRPPPGDHPWFRANAAGAQRQREQLASPRAGRPTRSHPPAPAQRQREQVAHRAQRAQLVRTNPAGAQRQREQVAHPRGARPTRSRQPCRGAAPARTSRHPRAGRPTRSHEPCRGAAPARTSRQPAGRRRQPHRQRRPALAPSAFADPRGTRPARPTAPNSFAPTLQGRSASANKSPPAGRRRQPHRQRRPATGTVRLRDPRGTRPAPTHRAQLVRTSPAGA